MAVYTKITESSFKEILKNYKIGNLISFTEIVEGIENTNYLLETSEGKFILTVFEKRVKKFDLPYFCNLMSHLNKKKFMSPKPIKDNFGKILQSLDRKNFIIVSFLNGIWKKNFTSNDCYKVGKIIATFHQNTSDFSFERKNNLSVNGWEKLINKLNNDNLITKIKKLDYELMDEISTTMEKCKKYWPSHLPKGTIHGDFFPDNIFFNKNNNVSGVIDFYFSCTDALVYEIAIAINAWCFNKNSDFLFANAKNLINGYISIKSLNQDELEYLPLLCEGASLRFLLTRLYDWFYTPNDVVVIKKDPLEYLSKLKFFKYEFLNYLKKYNGLKFE